MPPLTIELSWPEPCLWANARPDRHAKAAVARQGRNEAYVATLEVLGVQAFTQAAGLEIPVKIIGHKPNAIRRDKDGLLTACKSRLDGVAQALRIDDARFNPSVEWGEWKQPRGCVTVEIGQ